MNQEKQKILQDTTPDDRMDLLPWFISDPNVVVAGQHSCALLHAAHLGHADAVALLFPLFDPKAHR